MKNKRKIIYLMLLIIWMGIIFFMSNQPAHVSDSQSGLVIKILKYIGIDISITFGDLANFIVRKVAHFTEYMILAYLVFNVLEFYCTSDKSIIVFSILFVFMYALSDEIHQYFVPGRECALRDIIIDTLGGITSTLITYLLKKIPNKKVREVYN